jgi:hypothetical protein
MKIVYHDLIIISIWSNQKLSYYTCISLDHLYIVVESWLFSGDKQLDGYQKKKYVCKLLFIFLLGNDVDFGHMEAVDLLASNKYTEKQIVSSYNVN